MMEVVQKCGRMMCWPKWWSQTERQLIQGCYFDQGTLDVGSWGRRCLDLVLRGRALWIISDVDESKIKVRAALDFFVGSVHIVL